MSISGPTPESNGCCCATPRWRSSEASCRSREARAGGWNALWGDVVISQPGQGVDGCTAARVNLEVQVRAGRVAAVAGLSDDLAGQEGLAVGDLDARNVREVADRAVPVGNLDKDAVARLLARKDHRAGRHGDEVGANRDPEVLTSVQAPPAPAEVGCLWGVQERQLPAVLLR